MFRFLDPQQQRALPSQARRLGLSLDAGESAGPPGGDAPWWRAAHWRVSSDGRGICWDRGWDFADDCVREVRLLAPRGMLPQVASACARFLRAQGAAHLRWWTPLPLAPRSAVLWEAFGAQAISFDAERAALLYQWTPAPRTAPLRTARGLTIGSPRWFELPLLTRWSCDPEIYLPLGFAEAPAADALREAIFPSDPSARPERSLRFYAVRRDEQAVGLAIEHDWDYAEDSFKELDLALPGLNERAARDVLEVLAALMHNCYRRGARHVIGNVRSGPSGQGFPRLFAALGGHDIGAAVRQWGMGDSQRCYYAASSAAFYRSRAGQRWRASPSG